MVFRGMFFFFLFLEKMVGIPMQKVSYIMLKVDAEIANICFVVLCLSENGGCAGVTKRRQLHIFFRRVACHVILTPDHAPSLRQLFRFICTLVDI